MVGLKFEVKVDNYSGLMCIEELHKCYKKPKYHHLDKRKKPHYVPTNLSGCYFIHNAQKDIIYIGVSRISIRQRLIGHLLLEPSRYDEHSNHTYYHHLKKTEAKYFSYIVTEKEEAECMEIFLIRKFKPKYNIQYNPDYQS